MDLGQVIDYIIEFANNETKAQSGETPSKRAKQEDFDNF
jgi:hypothetical protein